MVECHSGYTYAQRPTALVWDGQRQEVAEVLADWHLPDGRRFRVRTTAEEVFELTYNQSNGEWHIRPIPFEMRSDTA